MTHNLLSTPFTWATGIEDTFIPHVRPGLRALDEYELTQHYTLWKSDIDLVAETGVQAVRWGIPWYLVQPSPDQWDWEWTDQVLDYLVNVKGITPILDLMHYGTPLWLENSFINYAYPERVAEYAARVASRYKSLVSCYTPLNEPMVNASMCGEKGEWPPYLTGEDGFVKLIMALAKGIALTTQAIKAEQPEAVTVQVEALWHTFTRDESLQPRVAQQNARQFLCFDLVTGRMGSDSLLMEYIRAHGATDSDLEWFQQNQVTFDIFGANFYPWSYTELKRRRDGKEQAVAQPASGHTIEVVLREAWERYHLPLMITETSSTGDIHARARWMDETLETVSSLRLQGIPIVGYTWFPLFTMVDWSYRKGRRALGEYLLHLGLYDSALDAAGVLRRQETSLVEHYREHMRQSLPPIAGGSAENKPIPPRIRCSLDGQWYFSPTKVTEYATASKITVPSPWQADERFRDLTGEAWYQREFNIPEEWLVEGRVVILGFGAIDYFAEVWVNDSKVGEHEGGYLPFELDITSAVHAGNNTVTVTVDDPLEIFSEIPHGKQSWYGMLSGIWQSVWVESRPAVHIQRIKISTFGEQVEIDVFLSEDRLDGLKAEVLDPDGEIVARLETDQPRFSMRVEDPRLWSPESPNLYRLRISTAHDELSETFGFRTIETRKGQILLNGRPFYLRGALDQDYYPDLISTPPSLEYIEDEFRKARDMGLNCLRVHIKAADPRYYEAADRVGLLIWTELPNHALLTEEAKRRARETLAGMVERDGNHPSIGIWTIINESWGIDLSDPSQRAWLSDTYHWLKELDPTRLVVDNSACWGNSHIVTDIADFHNYYAMPDHFKKWQRWIETYAGRPWWLFAHDYGEHKLWSEFLTDPWYSQERPLAFEVQQRGDEPLLVSEFGNWGLPNVQNLYDGNHGSAPWWFESGIGWSGGVVYPRGIEQRFREYHLHRVFPSLEALTKASQRLQLEALKFQIETLRAHPGIQGYVITELTDVHWESNGLVDMYRNPKIVSAQMHGFNADDVLIPLWDQLTYFGGETCILRILISHYSTMEIKDALVTWKIMDNDRTIGQGETPVGECSAFTVTDGGLLRLELPQVDAPTAMRIDLQLVNGERSIAATEVELLVFPDASPSRTALKIFSPGFQTFLAAQGYSLTDDLSQADVAIVTMLDDSLRKFILRGGRVLLLAEDESALQTFIPGLSLEKREGTPWQGDWASSFGWHRFEKVPTGSVVNFAFADLTPEYVLGGFSPRDFAFEVYAGMFVGWLHKPVPTIAKRRLGQGEMLVSTFRLSRNLENNPLALWLFVELMNLIQTD